MSSAALTLPAKSGKPKFSTECAVCGKSSRSISEARFTAFISHARSRRTLSLSFCMDKTRRSRDSCDFSGSSSASRSSNEGCRRSCSVRSAIGVVEHDLTDVHQRIFRRVGRQHPLAQTSDRGGTRLHPLGAPAQTDSGIFAYLGTWIAGRQQRDALVVPEQMSR